MSKMGVENSVKQFIARHKKSRELWESSLKLSRGVYHDGQHAEPFPLYWARGEGSHKWDVDGNEYIDYAMGGISLILGHAHSSLVEAISAQIGKGTNYFGNSELSLEWASLITRLVPSCERVTFVCTGNEANMMAAQIARAYTGKHKILKFAQHFFGWSDHFYVGVVPPFDKPVAGRTPSIFEDTVVVPTNDVEAMERALSKKDIAAIFIEAAGSHIGGIGIRPELAHTLRRLTEQYEALLVFDEVCTGFRWAPGGWQAVVGVTPDLTTFGKGLCGGIACGAIGGRADLMELLDFKKGDAEWNRYKHIRQSGSWNANVLSAAAGVSLLKQLASGEPQRRAEELNDRLLEGLNRKIKERGIDGCACGASSVVHLFFGNTQNCDRKYCMDPSAQAYISNVSDALSMNLLLNGVDILRGFLGAVSSVHTEEDIDQTIEAFGRALDTMIAEGEFDKSAEQLFPGDENEK